MYAWRPWSDSCSAPQSNTTYSIFGLNERVVHGDDVDGAVLDAEIVSLTLEAVIGAIAAHALRNTYGIVSSDSRESW